MVNQFYYKITDFDGTTHEGFLKTGSDDIFQWKEIAIEKVKDLKKNREGIRYKEKRFEHILVSNDFDKILFEPNSPLTNYFRDKQKIELGL